MQIVVVKLKQKWFVHIIEPKSFLKVIRLDKQKICKSIWLRNKLDQ